MKEIIANLEKEIQNLKEMQISLEERILELESWKKARMNQQITNPLDDASQTIINNRRIKT